MTVVLVGGAVIVVDSWVVVCGGAMMVLGVVVGGRPMAKLHNCW